MIPSKAIETAIATLLGADTGTLAEATPFVEVALVKASFSPSPNLVAADLVLADFDGSAAKHAASAGTQVFTDPATGEQIIQVNEPAGGWHWQTTGASNLPQVIYGFALLKSDGSVLHGSHLFDEPVSLNGIGQGVDIPEVNFRLPIGFMV